MIGAVARFLTCIAIICMLVVSGALVEPSDDV